MDPACGPPGIAWPVRILLLRNYLPTGRSVITGEQVTMNNCSVTPDMSDSCAMVAMVGFNTVRRREEAPMNCDDECAEWDICNEFETIDGIPVYYGGDLCDSDGSEWDDP